MLRASVAADRHGARRSRSAPASRSTCALLAAEAARARAGHRGGAAYVAPDDAQAPDPGRPHGPRSARRRHHAGLGDHAPGRVLRARRAAARGGRPRLGQDGISALLVALGDGELGIVTDADVRAAVAAGRRRADAPVRDDRARRRCRRCRSRSSPSRPPSTCSRPAPSTWRCSTATRVCGILSAADLLGLDARSPIGAAPHDPRRRRRGWARPGGRRTCPSCSWLLVRAGVPSRDLGRVLSLAARRRRRPAGRLLDLAPRRRRRCRGRGSTSAAPPGGSSRSPPTRTTRSPTRDPRGRRRRRRSTRYFERLGTDVNAGLARCGIGVDNNGVLAGKRLWRMSKPDWLRTFDECLTRARRVAPDPRHGRVRLPARRRRAGGRAPSSPARIRAAREHPPVHAPDGARRPAGFPVALGFRGQLATDRDGEPGHARPQAGAIIPLVNLVRFHALATRRDDLADARPDRGGGQRRRARARTRRRAARGLRGDQPAAVRAPCGADRRRRGRRTT